MAKSKYDELKELIMLNFRAIKSEYRAEFEVLNLSNKEMIKHQKATNGQVQASKIKAEECQKSVSFFRLLQKNPVKSIFVFCLIIFLMVKLSNYITLEEFKNFVFNTIF